ncbi:hypothetical protein LTR66_005807 [Elasticomyces elasticus]|nr:hypothetical protein LTR66_005807 [Elasticomyces elasticus]KAK5011429.1 hypothetical protein LTR28_003212 [Elasticomyces elasticus]
MDATEKQESLTQSHTPTASTPSSPVPATDAKPSAVKDRNCTFCNQAFTSSSLGRHLDLYIRPKNPKPSDGVHDVDAIRKLRASITRRQARASVRGSQASSEQRTSDGAAVEYDTRVVAGEESGVGRAGAAAASIDEMKSPVNVHDGERVRTRLNAANWQATGVINNLPPRFADHADTNAAAVSDPRHNSSAFRGGRLDAQRGQTDTAKMLEELEVGRAAVLALKEVLGSMDAAREEQLEAIKNYLRDYLAKRRPKDDTRSSNPLTTTAQTILAHKQQAYENETQKIYMHVNEAWSNWHGLSPASKQDIWQTEILRAFARATDRRIEKENELWQARQEIEHLQAQNQRLSQNQIPNEFLLSAPRTLGVGVETAREIDEWDYDRLLTRWSNVVKQTAHQGSGIGVSWFADPGAPSVSHDVTRDGRGPMLDAATHHAPNPAVQTYGFGNGGQPTGRRPAALEPQSGHASGNKRFVVSRPERYSNSMRGTNAEAEEEEDAAGEDDNDDMDHGNGPSNRPRMYSDLSDWPQSSDSPAQTTACQPQDPSQIAQPRPPSQVQTYSANGTSNGAAGQSDPLPGGNGTPYRFSIPNHLPSQYDGSHARHGSYGSNGTMLGMNAVNVNGKRASAYHLPDGRLKGPKLYHETSGPQDAVDGWE